MAHLVAKTCAFYEKKIQLSRPFRNVFLATAKKVVDLLINRLFSRFGPLEKWVKDHFLGKLAFQNLFVIDSSASEKFFTTFPPPIFNWLQVLENEADDEIFVAF